MLLPTIFPTPMSVCFFAIAIMDVINSGRDVPIATITTPITSWDNPKVSAIFTAPSTVRWPPRNSSITPAAIRPNDWG